MNSKAFLLAVAAFALTTTGVQAYGGGKLLSRAGLSEQQIEAFTEAHELRAAGEYERARDVLVEAGVTEETLHAIHEAARAARTAMKAAVANNDYDAFVKAVANTPLAEQVSSEAEFRELVKTHELRRNGEYEAANEIFNSLGIEPSHHHKGSSAHRGRGHRDVFAELTDEQRDAVRAARQANDREAARAILEEAGIDWPHRPNR